MIRVEKRSFSRCCRTSGGSLGTQADDASEVGFRRAWRRAIVTCCALGVSVWCAPAGWAQSSWHRLPPVRLPQVPPATSTVRGEISAFAADQAADGDLVRLAAGAVEMRVPRDWWIWEVPAGREVRVALAPQRPKALNQAPKSGYWVCFHLYTDRMAESGVELSDRLRQRLVELTGGNLVPQAGPQFHRLGPWEAVEQEFSLPPKGLGGPQRGSHVLVGTPWGWFEFHAQFAAADYEAHLPEMAHLLQQVTLSAPAMALERATVAETQAASPILGVWKAFRSRLRLSGRGAIEIAPDTVQLISPQALDGLPVRPELLRGRFRAEGDLLFVEWADGSKLNFRWKLREGDLLLTDHDGQISQLRRIAE